MYKLVYITLAYIGHTSMTLEQLIRFVAPTELQPAVLAQLKATISPLNSKERYAILARHRYHLSRQRKQTDKPADYIIPDGDGAWLVCTAHSYDILSTYDRAIAWWYSTTKHETGKRIGSGVLADIQAELRHEPKRRMSESIQIEPIMPPTHYKRRLDMTGGITANVGLAYSDGEVG